MMKRKYYLINNDEILGIGYESEYGDELVLMDKKIDFNYPITIVDAAGNKLENVNLVEYIHSVVYDIYNRKSNK